MITREELQKLLVSTETFRVEKTVSTTNTDKFCEAVCAFANDLPGSRQNGYLLLGVHDDGRLSGLEVTDQLMQNMAAIRSNGNILPIPSLSCFPFHFPEGDVLVVEVAPSLMPPVRYRGRTFVRVGPRKDVATPEEERILAERVTVNYPTFDSMPCREATLDDLELKLVRNEYLPEAINEEVLFTDQRELKVQMAALRLFNLKFDCPTYAAIILFGKRPEYFLPGTYIQFVRFAGRTNAAEIQNEIRFSGNLLQMLPRLEGFIETALVQKRPVPVSILKEKTRANYPQWAVRELMMNAVMHRDYQSNAPTRFYQYTDRLEVTNPGSLYGNARPENFPTVNDYRNPIVAEAMRILGYVNKFNRGISRVQLELEENLNGHAKFVVNKITVFEVQVNQALGDWDEPVLEEAGSNKAGSNKAGSNKAESNKAESNKAESNKAESNKAGSNKAESNKAESNKADQISAKSLEILELLRDQGRLSRKEIFNALEITTQTKNYGLLRSLITRHLINPTSQLPTSPNQQYEITDSGRDFLAHRVEH